MSIGISSTSDMYIEVGSTTILQRLLHNSMGLLYNSILL